MCELLNENTWDIRVGNHAKKASSTETCISFHIFGLLDIQQIFYGNDGVREPYLFEIM